MSIVLHSVLHSVGTTPSPSFHSHSFSQAFRQTPSTGLRHPSFKEEGAGKRCSECGFQDGSGSMVVPCPDGREVGGVGIERGEGGVGGGGGMHRPVHATLTLEMW